MPKASSEARKLWPYLLPLVERAVHATTIIQNGGGGTPGGGGSAPSPHDLFSSHHGGTLANAQAPQFLLLDGTRALEGNLAVDPGITIDGVDISVHVADPDAHHVRVAAGDGTLVNVALQEVAVDEDFDFDWTGTHTFDEDIQLNANLDFIGIRTITSSGSNHLNLLPGGDLVLDSTKTYRSSDYADGIPIAGFSNHINSINNRQLTINSIKADELHVRLFVADTVRVDVGEEYWGKSMGIVHTDFTTPGSIGGTVTMLVEDSPAFSGALFSTNDWVLIRIIDDSGGGLVVASIWGQVSSYTDLGDDADGRGHQSWTFTLRQGPTNTEVKSGNVIVDFGASGQGYVHLSTLDSADGPWIQIGEWNGANPYTPGNREIKTMIGNLDSVSDADFTPVGFGLYSDNAYLKGVVRTAETIMDDSGFALSFPTVDGSIIVDTSELARIAWRADINDPESFPAVEFLAYRDEISHISEVYNQLDVTVSDTASVDASFLNLRSSAGATSAFMELDSRGTLRFGATNSIISSSDVLPNVDVTHDLGSASFRWGTLYVDQVIADSISGATMAGAEWEYTGGSMVIDANNAADTSISIANQGAGRADLDVDRNITLGGTVDGVDIAGHAGNASAHHDPVTVGNTGLSLSTQVLSLALAATSGLQISSGLMLADTIAGAGLTIASKVLAVGAGDGISVAANDVAVDSTVVRTSRTLTAGNGLTGGGDLSANRTFAVGAGDGIVVTADDVAVDVEPTRGLVFVSGDLAMGTPNAVSATSTSGFSGDGHAHTVNAASDVSLAGTEWLLKSTAAGGLTLASLAVAGAATVDEDFTAADTAFRVINHTHDFPHAHVVINPGGLWSLDEQFGLDIDDNLLVRGWIVGKHAIQVADAEMLVHFDGPPPVETNFKGNPTGHMGQVGVKSGGATFRAGRFGKALLTGEATTNLITNPSFEVNTTGWSTIGVVDAFERRNGPNTVGSFCARLAISDNFSGIASNSMTFTSGQSYTFSFDVMHVDGLQDDNWIARFRKAGTGVSTFLAFTPPDEWGRVSLTWLCDATGSDYDLSIYSDVNTFSRIVIDAVQVEQKAYATPYCDGSLGGGETETGHSWSGTAHASTSSRAAAWVTYDDESLDDFGAPMTVIAWIKPTSASSYQTFVSKDDSGSTVGWDFANSSGTLRASIRGGGAAVADIAAGALTLDEWQMGAFTYDGNDLILYLDGVEVGSTTGAGTTKSTNTLLVGRRTIGNAYNGYTDELSLIKRVLTADEIRAIYESNAPIFAETSTWHWRSGRNRISADATGLWGLGANYGAILGLYAGEDNNPSATKSWGGLTLSEGDFLLGDANRGSYLLWDHSAANLTLGKTGTNNAALTLSGTDISMIYNSVERMRIDSSGFVMKDTAGVTRVNLGSGGGLALNDSAGVARVLMQSDGTLLIRNSATNPVFTFNASAGAEFTLPLTLGTSGGIYQGTGTFGSPTTGLKIWNQSGIGRIAGYNSGTLQWGAETDGRLTAGGGNVVLDEDGIAITAHASSPIYPYDPEHAVIWTHSGADVASISSWRPASTLVDNVLALYSEGDVSGKSSQIILRAHTYNRVDSAGIIIDGEGVHNLDGVSLNMSLSSFLNVTSRASFAQNSTTGAQATLALTQVDLSEELIRFNATVGASNPIDTAALGSYYGKVRVSVNGTFKYIALYNS